MYPISSTAKGYFDNNKKQVINIRMDTENETYTITENDIISGSFSIDRYSITGNRIEIGTACASECKFRIKNYSNQWDNVKFEGAVLYIRIGIADWENYTSESDIVWIPCGYFTIDKPVKNASILSIEALDRMAKLDKPVDWTYFQVTHTVSYLVSRICDICDVILANGSAIASMPNANYQVAFDMSAEITYRNLLQAACMLLGACAFFNENGQLVIKWYSATDVTINESKRYSHTIYENNIQITGVIYVDDTDSNNPVEYISGTKGYCIDISDNPLVGDDIQDVVDALGAVLNGFTYRPYSAVIKPSPYLYPMDMITFVKNNVSYTGIVSNITFGVNANTSIEGKGETDEDNGYATYGNLTGVQSKIIEYAKGKVDRQISDATTLLMNLNEMVMNSLGLYETSIQQPGGGYQYYFHDASTLANSTIIYTFGANGFAWTDDWNDGDPIWNYGITRDGNAIVNMLSAYKISADIITAGTMRAVNLIFGTDPNTTELRTNDESTGALFEGSGVMQFETKGEFLAKNMDSNNNIANQIRMRSDVSTTSGTYNRISFFNQKNAIMANQFYADAASDRNDFWFYNNRPGGSRNANNHYMGATSTAYVNRLYNFKFNTLTASGGAIDANDLVLNSDATRNYAALENRQNSGYRRNYIFMSAYSDDTDVVSSDNIDRSTVWFDNLKKSDTSTEYIANRIYMNFQPNATTPSNSFALINDDLSTNVSANYFQMYSAATYNSLNNWNYGINGYIRNSVSLYHSKNSEYNSVSIGNNSNDVVNNAIRAANSFSMQHSSTDNHISFFNKFLGSADTANETQFEGNSSGYVSYWTKNYDRENHSIANMIFMSSRPASHTINGAVIPVNNSLNLVNYQRNSNQIVNSKLTLTDSMSFETQNWFTFRFIGNGRQVVVGYAPGESGFRSCTAFYINGTNILPLLGL